MNKPPKTTATEETWEYKVATCGPWDEEMFLNEMAAQGWRPFHVGYDASEHQPKFYFERRKQ